MWVNQTLIFFLTSKNLITCILPRWLNKEVVVINDNLSHLKQVNLIFKITIATILYNFKNIPKLLTSIVSHSQKIFEQL
jgi:hypothetical protein